MARKPKKNRTQTDYGPARPERPISGDKRSAREFCTAAAVCGLLLLAVLFVFGQTLGHGFVNYDDNEYVYSNPHFARGLAEAIPWAFTATQCDNWHPLTWLSYLIDYRLYGSKPWGYHLTNVLLHAATTILLFLFLRRLTGHLWPSAFVAAVFAVHPLRVESVAWVAERKDVLSGLFFVLTLAAYADYVRRPFSLGRYVVVVALYALGLMAKPMLVTLPFVLLLLDYWPLERTRSLWRLVVEKLPLLALTAAFCVVALLTQHAAIIELKAIPFSARVANALVSYVTYVGQFFYPVGLAVFYPHHGGDLPAWQVVAAGLLLAGISIAVVVWRRNCPFGFVGWYWYVGMLVPVIGLMQVGMQGMADRYTYLPQIGLTIALAWGAKHALAPWPHGRWLLGAASALAVLVLMECARHQASFWVDGETLWRRAIACTDDNAVAYTSLGDALVGRGRPDDALAAYHKALEIQPSDKDTRVNLGKALVDCGRFDDAIAEFQEILNANPDFATAHYDLGIALVRKKQFDEAIPHFRKAVELKPDLADAHNSLGLTLANTGRLDEAVSQYEQSLAIQPDDAKCHNNLGAALARRGQWEPAIAHFQMALKLKPDYDDARRNLDAARSRQAELQLDKNQSSPRAVPPPVGPRSNNP